MLFSPTIGAANEGRAVINAQIEEIVAVRHVAMVPSSAEIAADINPVQLNGGGGAYTGAGGGGRTPRSAAFAQQQHRQRSSILFCSTLAVNLLSHSRFLFAL